MRDFGVNPKDFIRTCRLKSAHKKYLKKHKIKEAPPKEDALKKNSANENLDNQSDESSLPVIKNPYTYFNEEVFYTLCTDYDEDGKFSWQSEFVLSSYFVTPEEFVKKCHLDVPHQRVPMPKSLEEEIDDRPPLPVKNPYELDDESFRLVYEDYEANGKFREGTLILLEGFDIDPEDFIKTCFPNGRKKNRRNQHGDSTKSN